MLNDVQQKSLQAYFQHNMAQLSLAGNAFERALDIYQVVFAELDSDQIRIAHQRRKLASAILDRDEFASSIENYLACSDFDSILTYGKLLILPSW